MNSGARFRRALPLDFSLFIVYNYRVRKLRRFFPYFSGRPARFTAESPALQKSIWRCIEVVVTRLTRNQLEGNTSRGFESLHLRQKTQPHRGLGFVLEKSWRDSNHVRTSRRLVHEPVRSLANTNISFSRKNLCRRIPPSPPLNPAPHRGLGLVLEKSWRDSNHVRTSRGRVFSKRPERLCLEGGRIKEEQGVTVCSAVQPGAKKTHRHVTVGLRISKLTLAELK